MNISHPCLFQLYLILRNIATPHPKVVRHKEEKFFRDVDSGEDIEFPSLDSDEPAIRYSIIVPAYNEEERLPKMMNECLEYMEAGLRQDKRNTYEVIIVSDGSQDETVDRGWQYSKKYSTEKVRVLNLIRNRGKGGAVRLGMQSARGELLLFADADGATRFSDFGKIAEKLQEMCNDWKKEGIVVGSRSHLQEEAVAERSFFRNILMFGFHMLVYIFVVRKIRDTQCGFKLLTRQAARRLFQLMHVERWAFDVELLYLAERLNIPVAEIPVNWKEIEGSKIVPFWSWLQMGRDLILIWFHYTARIWKTELPKGNRND